MRRHENEHTNRMRNRLRKELERTQNPEVVRGILERSMYGKLFRAADGAGKGGRNTHGIGPGKSFAWLITDRYGNLNDTFFELLADAAARTVDKEYGVGTGVDEDEKAAKTAAVKGRLTRQLAGGVIKARARYYRLRLERACTLARSHCHAVLEAAPIEPGLLGGATSLHASSSAFDGPADDGGARGAALDPADLDTYGDDADMFFF